MSSRIAVHDPRGYPPKVAGKRLAPRLESLNGKVVYLVDCLTIRRIWNRCGMVRRAFAGGEDALIQTREAGSTPADARQWEDGDAATRCRALSTCRPTVVGSPCRWKSAVSRPSRTTLHVFRGLAKSAALANGAAHPPGVPAATRCRRIARTARAYIRATTRSPAVRAGAMEGAPPSPDQRSQGLERSTPRLLEPDTEDNLFAEPSSAIDDRLSPDYPPTKNASPACSSGTAIPDRWSALRPTGFK
jgi:hypothetical protein